MNPGPSATPAIEQRFYQRKKVETNGIVNIKAVAHKLCRASYYVMRDGVESEMVRAFWVFGAAASSYRGW